MITEAHLVPPDDYPIVTCPKCGVTSSDFDGFGLQFCARCGYCAHPALTGDTCDLCHRRVTEPQPAAQEPK